MKSTGYKPNKKKSLSIGLLLGEHATLQKKADEAGIPLNRWARAALGLPPGQQRGRPKAAAPIAISATPDTFATNCPHHPDWLQQQLAQIPKRG